MTKRKLDDKEKKLTENSIKRERRNIDDFKAKINVYGKQLEILNHNTHIINLQVDIDLHNNNSKIRDSY